MRSKIALTALAAAALLLLAGAASASAAIPFCLPGSGVGQCNEPQGLAVDTEEALVYVADSGNDRVSVFDVDGTFTSSFAVSGSPAWVAVDNNAAGASHHDIYVSSNEFVVRKFSPAGTPLDSLGEKGSGPCQLERADDPIAVGPAGMVYVADSYDKDGAGPLQVLVNRVQKFDPEGNCIGEVKLFEGASESVRDLAVDSAGDFYVSVAGAEGVLRKYGPTGTLLSNLGGVQTEGLSIDAAGNLFAKQRGDAVTRPASLYFIAEYASDVVVKRFGYTPGLAAGTSLAVLEKAEGVFATEGSVGVNFLPVPKGPVIVPEPCHVKPGGLGSVKATLQGEVNPENKVTSFHFEYVTQAEFEAEEFDNPEETEETPLPGSADLGLHEAAATVSGLTPEETYHCRVVAENADGEATGVEGTFITKEGFEFGPAWVSDVEESAATVNVEGNPLGLAANGEIEYVTDAGYEADKNSGGDGFAAALKTAPGELDFGTGEAMVLKSVRIGGLAPGTGYHYRLRVRNGVPPEGIICPELKLSCPELEHTFRTYLPEGAGESDDRHYELVSPGEKNSAEVAVPGTAAGFFEERTIRIQAGATSGEAVTYTSWTSFGEAEGAPATNQYLSRRGAGGWETENISPFGFLRSPLAPPFTGFTPDLRFGSMLTSEPALAAGCPEEYDNLYLRDNESGALKCLSPEAPNSTPEFVNCFTFAGSSADGSHAYFSAGVPYAGAPTGAGVSLYEWSASGGLKPVSILPGQSTPVPPSRDTSFGAADGNCVTGLATMRHVVSADGSRAIWTHTPALTVTPGEPGTQTVAVGGTAAGSFHLAFKEKDTVQLASNATALSVQKALEALPTIGSGNVEVSGTNPYTVTFKGPLAGSTISLFGEAASDLLVRIDGTETKQLDGKVSGAGMGGNGVFWAASADGSVVYFTDANRLIAGSDSEKGKPDLYRYDFNATPKLTNLTKNSLLLPGDVKGVVGASDDGSYVYFTAGAVLSGAEENEAKQKATAGKENLYLFHAGQTKFIATLDPRDEYVRSEQPRNLSARVSPDGRHLAFLSYASKALAGYDSTVADGRIVGNPPQHCVWDGPKEEFENDPTCAEAFLYDAEAGALHCVSCNPSGSRPLGPTLLPGWTNVYEGPRLLSDNGSRVFFETYDQLLPGDENLKRDVYGFETPGEGTCTAASANFDPVPGGCHFLVSSGKDGDESYLVDASGDGRDVFFSTRARLTGWDVNENFDVYDYRAGGGFPEPPVTPPACVGEAGCLAPPPQPPAAPTPATPIFTGPANAKPKKHKTKKHKKHHRKKHHADNKRRAER